MIYVRDDGGEWHWVTPAHTRRGMHKLLLWIVFVTATLMLASAYLFMSARYARAADLPRGWTCEQVRQIAVSVGGSLTWDRERTIAIAAAYGVALTDAQLKTLERCFK